MTNSLRLYPIYARKQSDREAPVPNTAGRARPVFRKSEFLALRRSDVDLDVGERRLPDAKSGPRAMRLAPPILYATAARPFLATSVSSLSEGPRGRFSPRSHWLTRPVVTLR